LKKSFIKSIVLISILFITLSLSAKNVSAYEGKYTNYYGIEITKEEYENLFNLGFTDEEIYYMDMPTYEENKDLEAKLLVRSTKYYKTVYPAYGMPYTVEVTKEEYDNADKVPQQLNREMTAYKNISANISLNGSYYRFKASTMWTTMPSNRSFDITCVGFGDPVYIASGIGFYYRYANSQGVYTTDYTYYNKKNTSTGGSAVYHLPTSQIVGLSSVLYYDVAKNTSNTITNLTICGDYSHATSTVSQSNIADYAINIYGIGLGPSLIGYYDAMACSIASTNISW